MRKPDFIISEKTGKEILDWCNAGSLENPSPTQGSVQPKIIEFRDDFKNIPKPKLPTIAPNEAFDNKGIKDSFEPSSDLENTTEEEVYEAIQKCQNIQELYGLYKAFPQFQSSLKADFEVRKSLIHIILYDDNSMESVIPKFAQLVKDFRNEGKLKDFGKYPVKAICWNTKMEENIKIRLGHYFSDFKKDIDKPKQDYTCLKDYLLYYDKSNKTIKPIQDNILNAFLKILRLENILNEERYFTKLQLLNRIKDQDFELFQSFRKQLYLWSTDIIKGKIDKVLEELKNYMNTFIKIFDKDTLQKSSDFLNKENASVQVIENTQNNIYSEEDINIEITTVHSVKGQTHCATLYLESFYYSDGGKSYESERLANAFLGNFITNRGIRVQQSLKMTYVGFSRPTNLLCVAIHKDRFNKYLSEIDRNDWEIIDCN